MSKVYCCSDLHGYYEAYEIIKNFIKPEDKVYCLGDCNDRGPQPWKTVMAVYNDPQFIYLMGNHEFMLINTIREIIEAETIDNYSFQLLTQNGGYHTFKQWQRASQNKNWYKRLRNLPSMIKYTNANNQTIILSHAGFTPPDTGLTLYELVWDREHIYDKWPEGQEEIIVHGHTPTYHFNHKKPEILKYAENHKIDIDLGITRTKTFALLDLDTLEPIYFKLTRED